MRSKVVRVLAPALALACVSFGMAQQQPGMPPSPPQVTKAAPEKSKLETMLAEALRNNPDIRVAAAKLAEADAELNRTRLQVTQKVVTLYHAIETQKKLVEQHESHIRFQTNAIRSAAVGSGFEKVSEAQQTLALAKGKLAELEAQLPAVLGKASQVESRTRMWEDRGFLEQYYQRIFDNTQTIKAQGPLAERIRKALQTSVKVDYAGVLLMDVLKDLEKKAPGLSLRDFVRGKERKVTLHFEEELPVSAILQALADDCYVRFLVRDYGIRVMPWDQTPPTDAMTVEEFLRQKPPKK